MLIPKLPLVGKTPKADIVITKNKVVYALIIALALFCVLKVSLSSRLAKELINANATIVLSQIKSLDDTDSFNRYFTSGAFCGWKIEKIPGGTTSSPDFEKTSLDQTNLGKDYKIGDITYNFTLCLSGFDSVDASANRQFVMILLITAAIIFLLNLKPTTNEKKIPNA